jgi:hypothetical protein
LREVFVLQNYSSKYKPNLHCHFGGIPAFFGIHSGTSYHAASAKEMKGLQRADEVAMKALSGCAWDRAAQLQLGTVSTRDDRLPLVKANIGSTSIHAPLRTERHIFRPHAIFCVNIPRAGRGPRKFAQTKTQRSQSRPRVQRMRLGVDSLLDPRRAGSAQGTTQ